MKDKQHLIVVDPTAFAGGSKVATKNMLALLNKDDFRITVLTADKESWQDNNINAVALFELPWLAQKEQGVAFFVRHAYIALMLLIARLRFGRFDIAVGASGPGVDLALYLLLPLLKFPIIQLIHGPVAASRCIARCLHAAQHVYYLQTTEDSLLAALNTLTPPAITLPTHFSVFQNGLSKDNWPTYCQQHTPKLFWAASLLKWKGLDYLMAALQAIATDKRPETAICYIKPQTIQLAITEAPINIKKVDWYENPNDLDQIRSTANIFISTSTNEPFGLSILEALAAGQCVVIPQDGAYWDKKLTDQENCIKYNPSDVDDLQKKLLMLSNDIKQVCQIGHRGSMMADNFRAEKQYQWIVNAIQQATTSDRANIRFTGGL